MTNIKNKMKVLICCIFAAAMVVSVMAAFAVNESTDKNVIKDNIIPTEIGETIHSIESKDTSLVRVIDDPEELCKWAADDVPGDIDKSYKLEKIEIFQYNTSELKYEDSISK